MTEERHSNDHEKSISRGSRVGQLSEVPPGVLAPRQVHLLDDFVVLKLHNGRILIAVTVIFGEYRQGLLGTIVRDQPSRRLWEEQNKAHDYSRHSRLNDGRCSPSPGVTQVEIGAIGGPTGKDVAKPPEGIVQTSHCAPVVRRGQLDSISWSSGRSYRGPET